MRSPLTILLFLLIAFTTRAQHATHGVGVLIGTATIQTDYGQKNNFLSSYGNNAISLSLAHYVHFFNVDTRWNADNEFNNHVMLKTELNLLTTANFEHYGAYTLGNSDLAKRLREMTGSVSMMGIGFQGEYYFNDLKEFMFPYSDMKWNPFVSIGFKYTSYTNTLTSTFDSGDWRSDPSILPVKYQDPDNIAVGDGKAFSLTLGTGTRYKVSEKLDAIANFNWQYFFSDAIDGLQTNNSSNSSNEWLLNFQVGLVYHLNFSSGLFSK